MDAQKAFHKAGRPDEAFRVLNELTLNAVNESRFDDASYYYWILSMQYADLAKGDERMVKKFREFQTKANIYYAYHTIQGGNSNRFRNCTKVKLERILVSNG